MYVYFLLFLDHFTMNLLDHRSSYVYELWSTRLSQLNKKVSSRL